MKSILKFIRRIAEDPYLPGDFKDSDEIGRPLEVKLVGQYAITYWADHAVKEIKVINVEAAGNWPTPKGSKPRSTQIVRRP